MDSISAILITKSLDGLSLRMAVTAANIANANSPAYRPQRVRFEDSLRAASRNGMAALRAVAPQVERAHASGAGDEPRLDSELADASETAMRYAALIDILGREMELTRLAVKGGQS